MGTSKKSLYEESDELTSSIIKDLEIYRRMSYISASRQVIAQELKDIIRSCVYLGDYDSSQLIDKLNNLIKKLENEKVDKKRN